MSLTVLPGLPADVDPRDVYYTDAFAALGAKIEGNSARPFVLEYKDDNGTIHMQCLARPIRGGTYRDITTPYGYGGPLLHGRPDCDRFIEELMIWAADNQFVSAFVRFDPVQANQQSFVHHASFVSNVVLVPTASEIDVLENLSPRYRKQYRRALRNGMKTEIRHGLSDRDVAEFRLFYEQSMRRVQAQNNYFFTDPFWSAVVANQDELGASITRTTVGGAIHATALRLSYGEYAYNFLSATSDAGRSSHATEFDKINYCLHAQRQGRLLVNFGGGVGGESDSLLEHKKRFAPESPPGDFYVGRFIFMPTEYERLAGAPASKTGPFPAYRFSYASSD